MKSVPEPFLEELRRRVDIVDVISEYVQLHRAGHSYTGLCPFHNERSPSLSVSPARQMFHCFGCGVGGTVIRFVMDIEGITFLQAVAKLAARANLQLPFELGQDTERPEHHSRNEQMKNAHELAAKLYSYILMNTTTGVQALTYLETRGFSRQTMAEFEMGYAPENGHTVTSFLLRRGFSLDLLVEAGISVELGHGPVDRFRSRVMIPIHNAQGKVVAFGGRTLLPDGKPKYLNSPETAIFHKGSVLYNYHRARREIRRLQSVFLLEGYMDIIAAWQAGVRNAVATMGTAFSVEQAGALKRAAKTLIVAYDGDDAGLNAAAKSLDAAKEAQLAARFVVFPEGMDPAEFIQRHGAPAFTRQMQVETLSGLAFLLHRLRSRSDMQTSAGRTEYIRDALKLVASRATPIEREFELKRLADEFEVSLEALNSELSQVSQQIAKDEAREAKRLPIRPSDDGSSLRRKQLPKGYIEAGNRILQLLLSDSRVADFLLERNVDMLALPEQTALLALLYSFWISHPAGSAAAFLDDLEDPDLIRLASSVMMDEEVSFVPEILEDYLRTVRLHQLDVAHKEAIEQCLRAQLTGDEASLAKWKARLDVVQQEILQLRTPQAKSSVGVKEAGNYERDK